MISGFIQANISVRGLHTSTRQFHHPPCRWGSPQLTGIACPSAVVRAHTADATDHWKQHQQFHEHDQVLNRQQQQQQEPAVANPATPIYSGELQAGQDLSARQDQAAQRSPAHGIPRKAAAGRGPGRVLRALCHYAPMDLSDGPASLSKVHLAPLLYSCCSHITSICLGRLDHRVGWKTFAVPAHSGSYGRQCRSPNMCRHATHFVCSITHTCLQVRPYDATDVQQALDHATLLLPKLGLQQMSNIAGALAAAGHFDSAFMQLLGDAAAARLRATPRLMQHTQGLQAFRIICWLAVGFSRLGVLHVDLLEQIALYGEVPYMMALRHTHVT